MVTRSNASGKSSGSMRAAKRQFRDSSSPYSGLELANEHEPPTAWNRVVKEPSLKRITGLNGKKVVEDKGDKWVEVKSRRRGKPSSEVEPQGKQTEVSEKVKVDGPVVMDWESGWPVLPVLVRVGTPVIFKNLKKSVAMN